MLLVGTIRVQGIPNTPSGMLLNVGSVTSRDSWKFSSALRHLPLSLLLSLTSPSPSASSSFFRSIQLLGVLQKLII